MSTRSRAWEEAARSLQIEPLPRTRPNPVLWARYAIWGPLPSRYRTWVLFDATCSTWVLRHVTRLLAVAVLPIAAVVLLLPGPIGVRVLTAVAASCGALLFTAIWVNESSDHRLMRAGWPAGIGPEPRERRAAIRAWFSTVRRL